MKKWTDKTEPLDKWLVKNETAVESNEPIGYDINYVKGQSEDAQVWLSFQSFILPLVLLKPGLHLRHKHKRKQHTQTQ